MFVPAARGERDAYHSTDAPHRRRLGPLVPGRKRRVFIPPKKSAGPRPEPGYINPPTGVTINRAALDGRSGLAPGDKVRILGTGLYAGETAVIERMAGGVVPAAVVRTEAGRARTVRTVDLEPAD
jgi:hypothetical protein